MKPKPKPMCFADLRRRPRREAIPWTVERRGPPSLRQEQTQTRLPKASRETSGRRGFRPRHGGVSTTAVSVTFHTTTCCHCRHRHIKLSSLLPSSAFPQHDPCQSCTSPYQIRITITITIHLYPQHHITIIHHPSPKSGVRSPLPPPPDLAVEQARFRKRRPRAASFTPARATA